MTYVGRCMPIINMMGGWVQKVIDISLLTIYLANMTWCLITVNLIST